MPGMPSQLHEVLVEMVRERPVLAAELLDPLGVSVPTFHTARLSSAELPEVAPTEYRADAVVTLDTDDKDTAPDQLEAWIRAAATATTIEDVIGPSTALGDPGTRSACRKPATDHGRIDGR
jgi:hypothetical protein